MRYHCYFIRYHSFFILYHWFFIGIIHSLSCIIDALFGIIGTLSCIISTLFGIIDALSCIIGTLWYINDAKCIHHQKVLRETAKRRCLYQVLLVSLAKPFEEKRSFIKPNRGLSKTPEAWRYVAKFLFKQKNNLVNPLAQVFRRMTCV